MRSAWPPLLALLGSAVVGCTPPANEPASAEVCAKPEGGCVLSNGMSLKTSTAPRTLTPIDVTLNDVPVTVTSVLIEAGMSGMSMPPVSVDMKASGPSQWSGQLILPVCSQGRSDWQWTLITRVGSGVQRTPILVEAGRP